MPLPHGYIPGEACAASAASAVGSLDVLTLPDRGLEVLNELKALVWCRLLQVALESPLGLCLQGPQLPPPVCILSALFLGSRIA